MDVRLATDKCASVKVDRRIILFLGAISLLGISLTIGVSATNGVSATKAGDSWKVKSGVNVCVSSTTSPVDSSKLKTGESVDRGSLSIVSTT